MNSSLKYFGSPFDTIEGMIGGISLHGIACFFVFFLITVLFVWLHILFVPPRRWRRMRRKLRSEQLPFLGWLVRDPLLVLLYYSMSLVAWSQIHLLRLISDWDLGSPAPPFHPPALKAISFDKSFSVRAGPFSHLRASRTWNDQAIEFKIAEGFQSERRGREGHMGLMEQAGGFFISYSRHDNGCYTITK